MDVPAPFDISVVEPQPQLRELHFSFTDDFQQMTIDQRLESIRAYIVTLIKQSGDMQDVDGQRGIMTVIQITEQLLPHIQSDSLPLNEVLIVEMGEAAEGSDLDELLAR